MTASNSILDQVRIASPCSADWKTMQGDERSRFCGSCQKHVFNFASMTLDEAMSLIQERDGHLCVRLFRRADGTVLTSDCPIGARAVLRRTRQLLTAVALAGIMIVVGFVLPNVIGAQTSSGRFRGGAVFQRATALWDDTLVWMGLRTRYAALGAVCAPMPLSSPASDGEVQSP